MNEYPCRHGTNPADFCNTCFSENIQEANGPLVCMNIMHSMYLKEIKYCKEPSCVAKYIHET